MPDAKYCEIQFGRFLFFAQSVALLDQIWLDKLIGMFLSYKSRKKV